MALWAREKGTGWLNKNTASIVAAALGDNGLLRGLNVGQCRGLSKRRNVSPLKDVVVGSLLFLLDINSH